MCNKIQILCCSVSELNSPLLSKTESSFMCYGRCDLRKSRYTEAKQNLHVAVKYTKLLRGQNY